MKTSEFRIWLSGLARLSRRQRVTVEHALGHSGSRSPLEWLDQTATHEISCPKCQAQHPYRWGRQTGMQRFRCRQCGHTFTGLSGTPLSRLRHRDRWLTYSEALIEGLTVRRAAHRCGIHKNTSFRWRHRFLQMSAQTKAQRLQGIAEADETYFPYSCKGQRHLGRPPRQRGHAIHARGTGKDQVPVLIVRDRS